MQAEINLNVGFTRNEMILEESLDECKVGRLLSQYHARRATRISLLQNIYTSLFSRNNTRQTRQAETPEGETTHMVI
jgi:hypothetical protein